MSDRARHFRDARIRIWQRRKNESRVVRTSTGTAPAFPQSVQVKGKLKSHAEVLSFLALAVCAEAGELANLIKKMWRGDDVDSSLLQDEIADIRIYLEHLARHLKIDLDQACTAKLDVVAQRLEAKEARRVTDA